MSAEITAATVIGGKLLDQIKEIMKDDKKNPQIVIVKSKATKFLKARIKKVTAVSTRSEKPQGVIDNPVDEDAVIKSISIIPNGNFKSSGQLLLKVNEVEIFQHDAAGDFSDMSILDIAMPTEGKIIQRGKSLEVFAWGTGNVTIYVQFDRKEVD